MDEPREDNPPRLLIVDDDASIQQHLKTILNSAGFDQVLLASSVEQAFDLLGNCDHAINGSAVDIILMDIHMPKVNGVEACKKIKRDPCFQHIPIVMVTGDADVQMLEEAFAAGATDYVTKPVNKIELMARLRSVIGIWQQDEKLRQLAHFDALTGLVNRPLLMDRLKQAIARASRVGGQVAMLFIDLDRFKQLNDTLGHAGGDLALKMVAKRLERHARGTDTVARLGGDEFVLLMPDCGTNEDAIRVAKGIVNRVSATLDLYGERWELGASVGVAIYPDDASDSEALLHMADQAMYHVKNTSKNGYCFFHQLTESDKHRSS